MEETPLWEQHLLSVLPFLCRFFPARCRWLMLLQVPSSHVTHFRFHSCCWSCELSSSKSRSVFFNLVGLLLGLRLSEFGLFLYPIIIRSLQYSLILSNAESMLFSIFSPYLFYRFWFWRGDFFKKLCGVIQSQAATIVVHTWESVNYKLRNKK